MVTWAPKEDTVDAFTCGDCWHLAWELHRLTGYPMIFSSMWTTEEYIPEPASFEWDHVAVVLPDGRIMDVNGVQGAQDWEERWNTENEVITSDPDEIKALLSDDIGKPLRRTYPTHNSRSLARRLTNHFNIPNKGRRQRDALPV